jgi:hypothetical protein
MIERRADEEQKTRRHQVKYSIRVLVTTPGASGVVGMLGDPLDGSLINEVR